MNLARLIMSETPNGRSAKGSDIQWRLQTLFTTHKQKISKKIYSHIITYVATQAYNKLTGSCDFLIQIRLRLANKEFLKLVVWAFGALKIWGLQLIWPNGYSVSACSTPSPTISPWSSLTAMIFKQTIGYSLNEFIFETPAWQNDERLQRLQRQHGTRTTDQLIDNH